MTLLAFETSSVACSVALLSGLGVKQKATQVPHQHAMLLLDWVSELLIESALSFNQLDAIAYSCGPGSFMGVRISAAIGQGFSMALAKPLIGIPSLQVIAQGAHRLFNVTKIHVINNARLGQAYYGRYYLGPKGIMIAKEEDTLCELEQLTFTDITFANTLLVTDILELADLYSKQSTFDQIITDYYPAALDVITLAEQALMASSSVDLLNSLPLYLGSEKFWRKANQ